MEQQVNGQYKIERQASAGTAGGLLISFQKQSWPKAKARWAAEDHQEFKKTGYHPKENVDCYQMTLDGGLNVTPWCRVRKFTEGTEYPDPDSGFMTDDPTRFPREWAAYLAGLTDEDQVIGFPLKHYFKNDPAKVDHYRYHKIYTLEQLAEMPQSLCQQIGMGTVTDKNAAEAFLAKARANADVTVHADALLQAEARIKALEETLAGRGIDTKKKLGRPKKTETIVKEDSDEN